ncbi:hypothetical protein D3C71_1453120 [compost metagenome]
MKWKSEAIQELRFRINRVQVRYRDSSWRPEEQLHTFLPFAVERRKNFVRFLAASKSMEIFQIDQGLILKRGEWNPMLLGCLLKLMIPCQRVRCIITPHYHLTNRILPENGIYDLLGLTVQNVKPSACLSI